MRRLLPDRALYKGISESGRASGEYENRLIFPLVANQIEILPAEQREFWRELVGWLCGSEFANMLIGKFGAQHIATLGKDPRRFQFGCEAMLVKDLNGYHIGPHTDVKSRFASIMFYMPSEPRYEKYGTVVYRANQKGLRSDGARHFPFEGFTRMATMPCRSNSMFAFMRNDESFHGVEPIDDPDCERDVLLYILRWRDPAAPRA